jgi:LemA protein
VTVLIVVVVVLALIGLWWISVYNSLISARNRVDESWSGIDVQLKRRHDLVPNLVETVKGYAAHEQKVLTEVTEARAQAMAATVPAEVGPAEARLGAALGGLRAVAEQYPDLKAAGPYQQLMGQLSELEDEIQASRRIYNANVETHNTRAQQFPNSIVAGSRFPARQFFALDSPAERAVPQVSF